MLPLNVLLLDIETTGLSRENDTLISIGLCYRKDDSLTHTSYWFLENPTHEKEVLERFLAFVKPYDSIFTYYGKGFEFPFLLSRIAHYDLDPSPFLRHKLIDIRLTLKHFASNRHTLEKQLDFCRTSQSTGRDVVNLYRTYLACNGEMYKQCILAHQKDELSSLCCLFELYDVLYHTEEWQLHTKHLSPSELQLVIRVPHNFEHTFLGETSAISFHYKASTNELLLRLPVLTGVMAHHLTPLKDYYYVASQNQVIHKSLAQFIPSRLRRKATKEECILTKAGTYLPLITPYKLTAPIWYDETHPVCIELSELTIDVLRIQLFYLFFQTQKQTQKTTLTTSPLDNNQKRDVTMDKFT